jgi:hypothetical protein
MHYFPSSIIHFNTIEVKIRMNIKGSVVIPVVKAIKSDKSGVFDKYLTNKDREIISQKLLPSMWYPFETYKHCINGAFEVYAKKNPEVIREWGRNVAQEAMTTIYAAFVTKRNPLDFLNTYEKIHKSFLDFSSVEVIPEKENQVLFKLLDLDPECIPFFYLIQGWLERGMELCGAKNTKLEFVSKSWEGKPDTSLRITWSL